MYFFCCKIIAGHLNNIHLNLKVSEDHVKIDFNGKLKLENGNQDKLLSWVNKMGSEIQEGFSIEFEYFKYNSIRLQVQCDGGKYEQYVIAFTFDEITNLVSGTLTLKSRFLGFHRSSEVTIQYGNFKISTIVHEFLRKLIHKQYCLSSSSVLP